MEKTATIQAKQLADFIFDNINSEFLAKMQEVTSAPAVIYGELARKGEGVTPKELSLLCNCVPSRVSAILDHLEKDGLAERYKKEGDHLHVYVRLTAEGSRKAQERAKETLCWFQKVMECLGEERAKTFIECISLINDYVKKEDTCHVATR